MHAPLKLFGPIHFAILAFIGLFGWAAALAGRRGPAVWRAVRWLLVVLAVGFGLTWYLYRYFGLHDPLKWALPLEICDASLWLCVLALLWPRQRILELAYFWGIAGASMALITPYLIAPLWSVPTVTFLAGHGMIVVSVIFLLGTGRMRPRPGSWWPALLILNGFALFDYIFDRLTGTNYMYLVHKPPISSLFNVMGPWPWYIAAADLLAVLLFGALQAPFRRASSRPRLP